MSIFKRLFNRRKPATVAAPVSAAQNLLAMLKRSKLFDAEWYLQHNPDVAAAGMDAALHYLHHGAGEGRLPGAKFDEAYYLSQLTSPLNTTLPNYASAFLHYLAEGEAAGLEPLRSWSDEPWWWQLPMLPAPEQDYGAMLHRLSQHKTVIAVIPVFNAIEAFKRCLAALELHQHGLSRVIVVDDASTDAAVNLLLQQYQSRPLFYCVSNTHNLGFSGSVNRGMTLAAELDSTADVVLLNSDTEVTAGWLRQLRYAAYSSTTIATVTPVSNNAGAFSVPQAGENTIPDAFDINRFARVLAQGGSRDYPLVPTGHGFCLYIRRVALNELGYFDAEAFPRGYGEENDFCMRALAAGWQHLIAPRAFVYHQRSASFGNEKKQLLQQGRQVIDQRYPQYTELVRAAFSADAVLSMRKRASLLAAMPLKQVQQIRPRALFVISTRSGGTPQTNQDLMLALSTELECFVLHCDSCTITLQHFAEGIYTDLQQHQLNEPIQALNHCNAEYDAVVAGWLLQWGIELVHVRHLAWHSLGLLQLVKTLGLPLVHSFHDFYTLCPTVKLLDEHNNYCAASCTAPQGQCQHELWPTDAFTALKHLQVYSWQQLFAENLSLCDAFVTTNSQAKALVLKKYPQLATKPFVVIEHGRNFAHWANLGCEPRPGEKLRLLCPGNISLAKGLALICELATNYADKLEIHILGKVSNELVLPANVVLHGSYAREQFLTLVAQIQPHCGAVLSIWPETWCHTLTELWAVGLPVVGLPFGAVAQRIHQHNAGWVAAEASAEIIAALLLNADFADDWQIKQQAVLNWQQQVGLKQTCEHMAQQYLALYHSIAPDIVEGGTHFDRL